MKHHCSKNAFFCFNVKEDPSYIKDTFEIEFAVN